MFEKNIMRKSEDKNMNMQNQNILFLEKFKSKTSLQKQSQQTFVQSKNHKYID